MLTTADLAAGITIIFSTVQQFWKLMVSIFGDPFSFFWDQVNTTCSWANTAGMNGIKVSLLKRYNTSLAPNGAKFYLGAVLSFSSLQQSGQTPMTYMTPYCLLNCLGLPSDWDEIYCLFLLFKEGMSLASTGTQRQPHQTEPSVVLFLWDYDL